MLRNTYSHCEMFYLETRPLRWVAAHEQRLGFSQNVHVSNLFHQLLNTHAHTYLNAFLLVKLMVDKQTIQQC